MFGGPLASTATIRGVSIFVASWQACTGTCRWLRPATGWSGRGSWYFVFVHSSVFVFVTLLFVFGKSCLMLNAWLCENECVHLPALWTVQLISVWIDSIQFLQLGKHAVRVGKCVCTFDDFQLFHLIYSSIHSCTGNWSIFQMNCPQVRFFKKANQVFLCRFLNGCQIQSDRKRL